MFGWSIARVTGDSMVPTLMDGDYVLARRIEGPPAPRMVVLIDHPRLGLIVKRIETLDEDGTVRVYGDNPFSTSPEKIGALAPDTIRARAHWRIAPKGISRLR